MFHYIRRTIKNRVHNFFTTEKHNSLKINKQNAEEALMEEIKKNELRIKHLQNKLKDLN